MDINIALFARRRHRPEIIAEATKVLDRTAAKFGHRIRYTEALVGAAAIDATGNPYPDTTHCICREADAVLFGAIGDPKYDNNPKAKVRPEQGLLRMRKALGLFANLRPVTVYEPLVDRSPLKSRRGARHGFHLRARADERHLFRTAGDATGTTRAPTTPAPTRSRRDRTGASRRLPAGRDTAAAPHGSRQGQRIGDVAHVARNGPAHRLRISRRDGRFHVRG